MVIFAADGAKGTFSSAIELCGDAYHYHVSHYGIKSYRKL